jgi:hypothetical protein
MTLSSHLSGPTVEPRVIRKQYAIEMAVERTRLLYQGSLLPTLFMLINGLVCAGLLWSPQRYFWSASGWSGCCRWWPCG